VKLIVAMIDPERLEEVTAALDQPGLFLLSVAVVGDASVSALTKIYRGSQVRVLQRSLRLEVVVVNEKLVPAAIEAVAAGQPDQPRVFGTGNVLVLPLEDCVTRAAPADLAHAERG
jgi:nitrogen regulatory protein PII